MGLKDFKEKLFPSEFSEDDSDIYDDEYVEEEKNERAPVQAPYDQPSNTSPRRNGGVGIASSSSIEMKVVTPTKFETVTQIADLLIAKKTVLLNLENTNRETAKRLIDFLSGVAYALGGDAQKVADNTFAITPNNVDVSSESVGQDEPADDEVGF